MIDEYTGMLSSLECELMNAYRLKDWGMSWADFLAQAQAEINQEMNFWIDCAIEGEKEE